MEILILWTIGWVILWFASVTFVLWRKHRYGYVLGFAWNTSKLKRRTQWIREIGWLGFGAFAIGSMIYAFFVFAFGVIAVGSGDGNAYGAFSSILFMLNLFVVTEIKYNLLGPSDIY